MTVNAKTMINCTAIALALFGIVVLARRKSE
jgi:hypothetical protein